MHDDKLNDYERIEAVKKKAELMEKQAKRTEKLIKVAKVAGNVDVQDNVQKLIEVNDSYIDAITAKLKILD